MNGIYNVATATDPSTFSHSIGYAAPNQTVNTGVDWTITPHVVSTTRFGYYFENYSNFGYPTTGAVDVWTVAGVGGTDNGCPLPASLAQGTAFKSAAYNSNHH